MIFSSFYGFDLKNPSSLKKCPASLYSTQWVLGPKTYIRTIFCTGSIIPSRFQEVWTSLKFFHFFLIGHLAQQPLGFRSRNCLHWQLIDSQESIDHRNCPVENFWNIDFSHRVGDPLKTVFFDMLISNNNHVINV